MSVMRVLLLWASDTSPNLGVRVLAAGHRALITSIWPQAEVVEHNFGAQATPVPMGSTRAEVKELLTGRGGVVDWLRDDFDLVVDTRSGDSFSDLYGLPRLTVMTLLAEAVRRSGTPLVYGPQTYGPYLSRRARLMAKWSLRHADLVLARDSTSAEVVAGLGRPADLVTTDVVFALPQPSSPRRDGDVLFNVSGLLWRGAADVDPGEYRRIVVEAIRGLGESGRRVTLLAHVLAGKSGDSDVEVIDEVVRAVGSPLPVFVPDSLQDARSGHGRRAPGHRIANARLPEQPLRRRPRHPPGLLAEVRTADAGHRVAAHHPTGIGSRPRRPGAAAGRGCGTG